jgi:hypothetical protein
MSKEIDEVIQEAIIKTLSTPQEVSSEAGTVKQHSLTDLVAIAKYLEQKEAAKAGIRIVKINNN